MINLMITKPVEVDCTFDEEGRVRVRRIRLGRPWQAVEQGRQWSDADGRHVLVMLPDGAHELVLRGDTLTWELRELPGTRRPA
ncbi:protein of unknown function [Candidatus Promineifilum breve]|uniref:Uncharacterized protein n=2 Tax=Candidatus Promineifilum breve TaxID=1806508 RepID=A0A160T359_9CHLR|nr:protein of unknown function [Candidatus Promineifilum breve]